MDIFYKLKGYVGSNKLEESGTADYTQFTHGH